MEAPLVLRTCAAFSARSLFALSARSGAVQPSPVRPVPSPIYFPPPAPGETEHLAALISQQLPHALPGVAAPIAGDRDTGEKRAIEKLGVAVPSKFGRYFDA